MMGDGMHKFGRGRAEFGLNPAGSRQIYLTFPADSTFKEEDVSNYFRCILFALNKFNSIPAFVWLIGLLHLQ